MYTIEYGAEWTDAITLWDTDWDRAMSTLSEGLADYVDRRLITLEEFTEGMEWVTGVVIDDVDVRISQDFGDLTIAVTITE